jgi:hypothetical protein
VPENAVSRPQGQPRTKETADFVRLDHPVSEPRGQKVLCSSYPPASEEAERFDPRATRGAAQALVVTTERWSSDTGLLQRYERATPRSPWTAVGPPVSSRRPADARALWPVRRPTSPGAAPASGPTRWATAPPTTTSSCSTTRAAFTSVPGRKTTTCARPTSARRPLACRSRGAEGARAFEHQKRPRRRPGRRGRFRRERPVDTGEEESCTPSRSRSGPCLASVTSLSG